MYDRHYRKIHINVQCKTRLSNRIFRLYINYLVYLLKTVIWINFISKIGHFLFISTHNYMHMHSLFNITLGKYLIYLLRHI